MGSLMVYTFPQVEQLAGLSRETITRWKKLGIFVPELPQNMVLDGPYRRVFSFGDVVSLRTLSTLRREHRVKLSALGKAGMYLRRHADRSLTDVRIWVIDRQVVFREPAADRSGDDLGHNKQAFDVVDVDRIAKDVETDSAIYRVREPSTRGHIAQDPNIMGN